MAGKVDFRDDGYMPLGCITNQFACLLLSVKASIGDTVRRFEITAYAGAFPDGAHLGQQRVFLYFNAPALVIRQMPVKSVDVMQRYHVNKRLDRIEREEMTCHIEMCPAIREPRIIIYIDRREHHGLLPGRRD
jgi:hypothetical protein